MYILSEINIPRKKEKLIEELNRQTQVLGSKILLRLHLGTIYYDPRDHHK